MHTPTIDPDSPLLVTTATCALTLLGATTGGTIAVLRARPPLPLVLGMGLNGAVAGLSFFGIREYVVSPLLVASLDSTSYARRRGAQEVVAPDQELRLIRNDRVLDSGLAGGLAGCTISGFVRGPRTIPASFITSALITTTLQYTLNAIRAARLSTLITQQNNPAPLPPPAEPPTKGESFLARVQATLGKWSPVRKLSDDEYLAILGRQRDEVRGALDKWEGWMAASAASGASSSSGTSGTNTGLVSAASTPLAHPVPPIGKKPEINVEQATRELDSLSRKIRAVEDKIRAAAGSGM